MGSQSPSFTNQDLRNRSFRRQTLNSANFSGADVRGCDFSQASLVGANFSRAQMGQTNRQRLVWVTTAIATFWLSGHATSLLVFGALGQTPGDRAWNYGIILVICLGLAGGLTGAWVWLPPNSFWDRLTRVLSGTISGAVTGFYYAGVAAAKDPGWAIAGAIAGGFLMGAIGFGLKKPVGVELVTRMAGAINAYGFAFLVGATGLSFLNLGDWAAGFTLGGLSILFLWLTLMALTKVIITIRQAPGTCFWQANLDGANFAEARTTHAEFSQALGFFPERK